MREDIAAAYQLLSEKGRGSIEGFRAAGQIKKAFQKLEEFVPDEQVLALATGGDVDRSFGDKVLHGQGYGEKREIAKSARLLVLTELNFYQVQATGRLNGNKPQAIQIRLGDVTDVRARSNRKLTATERILMVDHMRGAQVETEVISMSTDNELEVFPPLLQAQVATVNDLIAEQERQDRSPAVTQTRVSVADELAKLVQLKEAGVLSEDEFGAQKAKLLG